MDAALPICLRERLSLPARFACVASCYWLAIFPQVRRERGGWRLRAQQIPDPLLRRLALQMQQGKIGNVEGAAAFGVFARRAHRDSVVAAQVAFQTAYDYADVLAERDSDDSVANGRTLHRALLLAGESAGTHGDYYAHCGSLDDAGYLPALSDAFRAAYGGMPARTALAAALERAVGRIVAYQGANHHHPYGTHLALAAWAGSQTPAGADLRWWETAASAGSSAGIFSFIAAASHPQMDRRIVAQMEGAYFPWAGSLHTLLDSLVDRAEDAGGGQRSLLDYYRGEGEARLRMTHIAEQAVRRLRALPDGQGHLIVFAAMASLYVISVRSDASADHAISGAVLASIGTPVVPALIVFALRRAILRLRGHKDANAHSSESCSCLGEGVSGASVSLGRPRLDQWPITCWLRQLW
jgi:hypothetical protein